MCDSCLQGDTACEVPCSCTRQSGAITRWLVNRGLTGSGNKKGAGHGFLKPRVSSSYVPLGDKSDTVLLCL